MEAGIAKSNIKRIETRTPLANNSLEIYKITSSSILFKNDFISSRKVKNITITKTRAKNNNIWLINVGFVRAVLRPFFVKTSSDLASAYPPFLRSAKTGSSSKGSTFRSSRLPSNAWTNALRHASETTDPGCGSIDFTASVHSRRAPASVGEYSTSSGGGSLFFTASSASHHLI